MDYYKQLRNSKVLISISLTLFSSSNLGFNIDDCDNLWSLSRLSDSIKKSVNFLSLDQATNVKPKLYCKLVTVAPGHLSIFVFLF